jgi:hypothetical protein
MNLTYFFASAALLISILSFLYLRAYTKKRTTLERIPEDVRSEVQEIINEIDRITDRDLLLVEERIKYFKTTMQDCEKKINAIIDDADRRIGVLSREVESRARKEDVYTQIGRRGGAIPKPAPVLPETVVAPTPVAAAADAVAAASANANAESEIHETLTQKEKILNLSTAGYSAAQIASKLGINVSAVEMMLYVGEQ